MVKITLPGDHPSRDGLLAGISFTEGRAEVESLGDNAKAFLKTQGARFREHRPRPADDAQEDSQMSYAVRADYEEWAGNLAGEDVDDALLARAASVVDDLTAGVPYRLAEDGTPAGPVRKALVAATCAQAHFMDETGDASGAFASSGGARIGSVQLPARSGGGRVQDARYAPEAVQALRSAGLLNRRVAY